MLIKVISAADNESINHVANLIFCSYQFKPNETLSISATDANKMGNNECLNGLIQAKNLLDFFTVHSTKCSSLYKWLDVSSSMGWLYECN